MSGLTRRQIVAAGVRWGAVAPLAGCSKSSGSPPRADGGAGVDLAGDEPRGDTAREAAADRSPFEVAPVPDGGIIDCHIHFLYKGSHDDARDPAVFAAKVSPLGVRGAVVIEAGSNDDVLALYDTSPIFVGFSGKLPQIGDPAFAQALKTYAANKYFRGVHVSGGDFIPTSDAASKRDANSMADLDMELDVKWGWERWAAAADSARLFPNLRYVLNHFGNYGYAGGAPTNAFMTNLKLVARQPNVFCKISALTELVPQATGPEFFKPLFDELWKAFGEDRLIFGSDWPNVDYAKELEITRAYLADKPKAMAEKFYWKNALTAYKWVSRV